MSILGPNNGDQCLFVQSIRAYPSTLEIQKPRRLITLTMRSAFGLRRLQWTFCLLPLARQTVSIMGGQYPWEAHLEHGHLLW